MFCSNCGKEYEGNFCPACGAPAQPAAPIELKCPACGASVEGKFCTCCGTAVASAPQQPPQPQPQVQYVQPPQIIIQNTNTNDNANMPYDPRLPGAPKDKWVAFLLCLFFGVLGLHKFYEGKVGMGVLYLFTGGLCGIGWFVDCISLLLKPNPYYVYR